MIKTYAVIDEKRVSCTAANTFEPSEKEVSMILGRAGAAKGLTLEEAALLLSIKDPARLEELYRKASEVKLKVFGKRVVLFAPLYISNYCTNGCVYCGFSSTNRSVERKALSVDEAVREAKSLEAMGFKRVLLVTGEDPRWGLDYVISCVKAIYDKTGMRIVHVNAPPMGVDEFRLLKDSGVGVYQSFQETYHRETYSVMHPSGKKKDFDFRLETMDRAMEGGFDDVGIGPLFGLYDYRFEALAAIAHSKHLYEEYGAHAHTISIPRLRPAGGARLDEIPHPVTDEDLKKIVAVLRLSVPPAGIVVSTRESRELRTELLHIGASQMSAASRTNPGGYSVDERSLEQFSTNDHRGLGEVMASIISEGYLPSLCTSCYRAGRTGPDFAKRTASGEMGRLCRANAILTLKEYLLDNAGSGVKEGIERVISESIDEIEDLPLRKAVLERLKRMDEGERDLFF